MSKILPNTYQTPNAYVDMAMQYLTGEEFKVLIFATRHILGWQDKIAKQSGKISLSMFENGRAGVADMDGCGLAKQTIIDCLKTLHEMRLLIRVEEYNDKGELIKPGPTGQEYQIGLDPDWEKIKVNHMERAQKKGEAAKKARAAKAAKKTTDLPDDTNPSTTQTSGGSVRQTTNPSTTQTAPGLPDRPTGGLPDSTHIKPVVKATPKTNTKKDSADAISPLPIKEATPHQLWFGALCQAFDYDVSKLTEAESKRIGSVAKQMVGKYDPKWAMPIYMYLVVSFDNATVHAVATHAQDAVKWYLEEFGGEPRPYDPDWKPKREQSADEPERVADGVNYHDYSVELDALFEQAANNMTGLKPKVSA